MGYIYMVICVRIRILYIYTHTYTYISYVYIYRKRELLLRLAHRRNLEEGRGIYTWLHVKEQRLNDGRKHKGYPCTRENEKMKIKAP